MSHNKIFLSMKGQTKVVCARHGTLLEGASPLHTHQGEVLAKGKGVAVRRGLKEARSKALA